MSATNPKPKSSRHVRAALYGLGTGLALFAALAYLEADPSAYGGAGTFLGAYFICIGASSARHLGEGRNGKGGAHG